MYVLAGLTVRRAGIMVAGSIESLTEFLDISMTLLLNMFASNRYQIAMV